MLEKSKFYWFFHGLMNSQKNINKNKIKWFTTIVVKYVVVQFSQKKHCVLTKNNFWYKQKTTWNICLLNSSEFVTLVVFVFLLLPLTVCDKFTTP